MKSTKKLVLELKRLNQKLDRINYSDRFMVYNANPLKFAWFNFIGGIFHSIGVLIGTIIITGLIVYFLSRVNFPKSFSDWINQFVSRPTSSEQVIYQPRN